MAKSFQHFVLTASIISTISCFVLLYKVDDKEMSLFYRWRSMVLDEIVKTENIFLE